jgi:uncharacterized protein YabN with tetrapyrrole methylase and pyrophosphatase domain
MSFSDGTLPRRKGTLKVVGTGITFPDHLTDGARSAICDADIVLYVVDNKATEAWIRTTARQAEALRTPNADARRLSVYDAMVERTLNYVRAGLGVAAVFYGHPGMFSYPGHEAVRRARSEGYCADILPAVSSVDCLYADLALDPAYHGYQVFDATDFLIHRRAVNVATDLILLQAAMVGDPAYERYRAPGLGLLMEALADMYGLKHEIVIYEGAAESGDSASIRRIPLAGLGEIGLKASSTLYVPPKHEAASDLHMLIRLAREIP